MSSWASLAKSGKRAQKRPSLREMIDRFYHKRMIGEVSEKQDNLQQFAILAQIIQKHIKQNTERMENHRSIAIHPSSISNCQRAVVYNLLGAEEQDPGATTIESSGKSQRIFSNGDYYHLRMQTLMVHMGLATVSSVEVGFHNKELNIMGTTDGIITPEKNLRAILELKSINDRGYKALDKSGQPEFKHVEQAHVYMWAHNCKVAYILYENKNDQLLDEHVIEYDQELMNSLLARGKSLWQHVKMQKMPERPAVAGLGSRYCAYCPFSHLCFYPEKEKKWLVSLKKETANGNSTESKKGPQIPARNPVIRPSITASLKARGIVFKK